MSEFRITDVHSVHGLVTRLVLRTGDTETWHRIVDSRGHRYRHGEREAYGRIHMPRFTGNDQDPDFEVALKVSYEHHIGPAPSADDAEF